MADPIKLELNGVNVALVTALRALLDAILAERKKRKEAKRDR